MNRTLKILKHELLGTVRRTSFMVMTLIVPALIMVAIGITKIVSAAPSAKTTQTIGCVDQTGTFGGFMQQGSATLIAFKTVEDANLALSTGEINQYIVIPEDYLTTGTVRRFTSTKELIPQEWVTSVVKSFLTANLLAGKVPRSVELLVESPLLLTTTKLDADGSVAKDQGGIGTALVPLLFSLLLTLSIIFSSSYLLNDLAEEKENRLMEILISRVSPGELLAGKFLGIGAAGLVQVLVWLATLPGLLALASAAVGGFWTSIQAPFYFYVLCFTYFLLGYSVFGVLNAGVGAISPTVRDGQQMTALFNLFPVVPLWLISLFLAFPQSPAWTALSIFPLTAPSMIIARLSIGEVAPWELAASICLLVASAAGGLFLGARVFRTQLLRYGKRRLGDALRGAHRP